MDCTECVKPFSATLRKIPSYDVIIPAKKNVYFAHSVSCIWEACFTKYYNPVLNIRAKFSQQNKNTNGSITLPIRRRFFFYLLDYVTSAEIFRIGDHKKKKKKKTWTPFIVIFTQFTKAERYFKIIIYSGISDYAKNKLFRGDVRQKSFTLFFFF